MPKQARGKDLREKMIKSEKDGEDYRGSHNGRDTVQPDVPRRNYRKSEKFKK